MSSPNTPDNQNPSNGEPGPQDSGMPGPGKGGMVPPWQRGTGGPVGDGPNGTPRQGPPPHGIVSADEPNRGGSAPITKLDDPRNPSNDVGPEHQSAPTYAGEQQYAGEQHSDERFVESPTRTIEREELPGEKLPNLDAIHHVGGPAAAPSTRVAPTEIGATRALRAAVQIRRIDPWATFKISAVLAVVGFFIWMIAVALLYLILDGMGVWDQINSSFGTVFTADGSTSEGDIISAGTLFGWSVLIGAIFSILLTALATISAYIYNVCADLIGGAEITIADLD